MKKLLVNLLTASILSGCGSSLKYELGDPFFKPSRIIFEKIEKSKFDQTFYNYSLEMLQKNSKLELIIYKQLINRENFPVEIINKQEEIQFQEYEIYEEANNPAMLSFVGGSIGAVGGSVLGTMLGSINLDQERSGLGTGAIIGTLSGAFLGSIIAPIFFTYEKKDNEILQLGYRRYNEVERKTEIVNTRDTILKKDLAQNIELILTSEYVYFDKFNRISIKTDKFGKYETNIFVKEIDVVLDKNELNKTKLIRDLRFLGLNEVANKKIEDTNEIEYPITITFPDKIKQIIKIKGYKFNKEINLE